MPSIKKYQMWIIGLSALILLTPIIILDVGPDGYALYGPDVPDVYIFGCTILGKDRAWWGINFAYKFQLIMIITYISITIISFIKTQRGALTFRPMLLNLILLLLFPFWLYLYIGGVISNSDGADLKIYPHIGLILYLIIIVLNVKVLIESKKVATNTG